MGYYYWDPTYILVVIGAVICMIASARVKGTFNKYSQLRSMSGMNGAQVAQRVLQAAGIYDVQVRHVSGSLTDHYDPRTKTVNLSDPVYNATSVAALGVAAHECGHAIQHAKSYAPLSIRSALVPIANFGSMLAWPVILIGLFFNTRSSGLIIDIGILLFSAAVLFQLVTLPVEFDASNRALAWMQTANITTASEQEGAKDALKWAALTYVVAALASIAMLLQYVMILIRHYHQMTCKHKGIFNLLEMKSNLFGKSPMG